MQHLARIFKDGGGQFVSPIEDIQNRLSTIKAFLFDWDGVFNNSAKMGKEGSPYQESDSMGTNLLRFSYWLKNGDLPITGIITGAENRTALFLAEREHFPVFFFNYKNKLPAFQQVCETYNLQPKEIAFVFDDVLDFSVAEQCGLRFLVQRKGSPLMTNFVKNRNICDYVTGNEGGQSAVREIAELLIGLQGNYEEVVEKRYQFSGTYATYLKLRNEVITHSYNFKNV